MEKDIFCKEKRDKRSDGWLENKEVKENVMEKNRSVK